MSGVRGLSPASQVTFSRCVSAGNGVENTALSQKRPIDLPPGLPLRRNRLLQLPLGNVSEARCCSDVTLPAGCGRHDLPQR